MRIAIVHDWLTGMRGGERVLELFCHLFPDAHIFTLFHDKGSVSPTIESHPIITSRLQKIPGSKRFYRHLLPLFPGAIESFDLSGFDLIISTSHAVAKGAIPPRNALSVCYCHTPMRYIWDQYDIYFNPDNSSRVVRAVMPVVRDYLRHWDVATHDRVDHFIANSRFVANRIKRFYNRDSVVIPAPVDCDYYCPGDTDPEDFYLIVTALAPYKRVDIAIEAFNENGKPLKIIGSGTESNTLERKASDNIGFLGRLSDDDVRDHYRRCKALIFPGVEDFGLVPLEVQACGRPVIAFGEGGALETVTEGVSGHFFYNQSAASLNNAINAFEQMTFSSDMIRKRAFEFDINVVRYRLQTFFDTLCHENNLPLITTEPQR